jgi:hypothetical protein
MGRTATKPITGPLPSEVKARYIIGLTATLQQRDGYDASDDRPNIGIQEAYRALAHDEARNRRIVDAVIAASRRQRVSTWAR